MALHAACPGIGLRWLKCASCAAIAGALFAAVLCAAQADTFGSGSNEFTIDFVAIGSVNNPADTVQNANDPGDTNRYGAVSYAYRISTYEISQSVVAKATNAGLANVTAQHWGPDRPAVNISWYEAAAFVNWLNTSKGYSPAYNLVFTNGAWSMQLWDSTNAWTAGGTNLYRHKDSFYFLPSVNEWYKAAYYNPSGSNYFLYPTAGNSPPASVAAGTNPGTAVYLRDTGQGPAAATNAGGLSPFGTMGQGGNVWDWLETASDGTNNSPTENRQSRGGLYFSVTPILASTHPSFDQFPTSESFGTGFRVASALAIRQNTATIDFGGSVQTAGDRLNIGFVGSPGVVATAGDGDRVARQGGVGMVYFPAGYGIGADSPTINEAGSSPESSTRTTLSARQLFDDGTFGPTGASVTWNPVTDQVITITPGGIAQASTVYENTIANFTATIGGDSFTNFLTVINTLPDNFGAWAGDTFDDAWEIAQGMTGALDPTSLNNGVPAWQLYAMGINPAVPFTGNPAPARVGTNGGFLTISYTRNPYATGYTFNPQEAGNLAIGFSNITAPVSTTNPVNGVEQITTRGSVPISSTNRQFLRLQITRPQP